MRRIELVGNVQSDTTRKKNNISILFRCWILISFDSRQAGITRTPALARCSCCTRCPIRKTFHCTFSWLKIFSLYALYNKHLSFSGYHILPSLPLLTRGPYRGILSIPDIGAWLPASINFIDPIPVVRVTSLLSTRYVSSVPYRLSYLATYT